MNTGELFFSLVWCVKQLKSFMMIDAIIKIVTFLTGLKSFALLIY